MHFKKEGLPEPPRRIHVPQHPFLAALSIEPYTNPKFIRPKLPPQILIIRQTSQQASETNRTPQSAVILSTNSSCHPERSVAKSKDLRLFLSLPLLFCVCHPRRGSASVFDAPCFSVCHSLRESAVL